MELIISILSIITGLILLLISILSPITAPMCSGSGGNTVDKYQEIKSILKKYEKYTRRSPKSLTPMDEINARVESQKYAWGFPGTRTVKEIAKFINNNSIGILSLGAGNGVWECLLSHEIKAPLYAIDRDESNNYGYMAARHVEKYYPIDRIDVFKDEFAEYIKDKSIDTLFTSWPSYKSSMVTKCAEILRPKYIIYIGEPRSGCTGDKSMHELFSKFIILARPFYPRWGGMTDECIIYETNY